MAAVWVFAFLHTVLSEGQVWLQSRLHLASALDGQGTRVWPVLQPLSGGAALLKTLHCPLASGRWWKGLTLRAEVSVKVSACAWRAGRRPPSPGAAAPSAAHYYSISAL